VRKVAMLTACPGGVGKVNLIVARLELVVEPEMSLSWPQVQSPLTSK